MRVRKFLKAAFRLNEQRLRHCGRGANLVTASAC
jgi:hypothetical protein